MANVGNRGYFTVSHRSMHIIHIHDFTLDDYNFFHISLTL